MAGSKFQKGPSVPATPPQSPAATAGGVEAESENHELPGDKPIGEVVVRTMHDDLSAVRSGNKTVLVKAQPVMAPAPRAKKMAAQSQPRSASKLPLSPTGGAKQTKVVKAPRQRRRKSGKLVRVLMGSLIAIAVLGASGAYGVWWYVNQATGPGGGARVGIEQLLPLNTAIIVQYKLADPRDRSDIMTVWSNRSASYDVKDWIEGDPRLVLDDADLTEIYYVVLENDTRPYVIVPQTKWMAGFLEDTTRVQAVEHEGWYVIGQASPDSYLQELAQGTFQAEGGESIFSEEIVGAVDGEMDVRTPIRVVVGPQMIMQIRAQLVGEDAEVGALQKLSMVGRVIRGGDGLELAGEAKVLRDSINVVDQELLSLLPAGALVVRLGADWQADVSAWAQVGVLDSQVLRQVKVQSLLEKLDGPYAFYVDDTGFSKAYGVVVKLSSSAKNELVLGQESLEAGLISLSPLLIGRSSLTPVEFSEGEYRGEKLRYANLSKTQALDYALVENYLLIATSKEAMFSLIDTAVGENESIISDRQYADLLSLWGAVPVGQDFVLGEITSTLLKQLLPVDQGSEVVFGLVGQASGDDNEGIVRIIIKLVN